MFHIMFWSFLHGQHVDLLCFSENNFVSVLWCIAIIFVQRSCEYLFLFHDSLLFYNVLYRDDSHYRGKFIERLIEDRSESALSYYEFLQHLKSNIKWWKKRYYVIFEMCLIYMLCIHSHVVCRVINSCCCLKLKLKL